MNKIYSLLFVIFFLSCNRDSLELPPPKDDLIVRTVYCSYGNTNIVAIKFTQDTISNQEGKVNIQVTNLTGAEINECKIYIEMCDGEPSLKTCKNQFVYTVAQFQESKADSATLPFLNINLRRVNIVAGVISTSDKTAFLSSVYDGNYVRYVYNPKHFYPTGHVKGVVFADGESLFRLSLDDIADTTYYNVTGKFADTALFNSGSFLTQANFSAPFAIKSTISLEAQGNKTGYFKYTDSKAVKFGLKLATPLPTPTDNTNYIDSVLFNLTKQ